MKVQFSNSSSETTVELSKVDVQRLIDGETLDNAGISISFDERAQNELGAKDDLEFCHDELFDCQGERDAYRGGLDDCQEGFDDLLQHREQP